MLGVFAVILALLVIALVPLRGPPEAEPPREPEPWSLLAMSVAGLTDAEIDAALAYAASIDPTTWGPESGLVVLSLCDFTPQYGCYYCGQMYESLNSCVFHVHVEHESEVDRAQAKAG